MSYIYSAFDSYKSIEKNLEMLSSITEDKEFNDLLLEISEQVHHQGDFYPATVIAIPYLFHLIETRKNSIYQQYLIFSYIGNWISSEQEEIVNGMSKEQIKAYTDSLYLLKDSFIDFIKQNKAKLIHYKEIDISWLALAALAILDDKKAAMSFSFMYPWTECSIACKHCEYYDEKIDFSLQLPIKNIEPLESVIGEWDGSDYSNTYLWFSNFLNELGEKELLARLPYYYGIFSCPECQTKASTIDFIKNFFQV